MKLKVINATLAEAVKLQNQTLHSFITSVKTDAKLVTFDLEYDTEAQLLMIGFGKQNIIAVGITNIKVMTLETSSGTEPGTKAKK